MILFTVGTHEAPFDRMIRAAVRVAECSGERVVVQRGHTRVPAPGCEVYDLLPPSRFEPLIDEARVVVTHAGPATIERVIHAGKWPLIFPRLPEYGEHVDDHQRRFARQLDAAGRIFFDTGALVEAVVSGERPSEPFEVPVIGWSGCSADEVARAFSRVVDSAAQVSRQSPLGHATLWTPVTAIRRIVHSIFRTPTSR